MKDVATHYEKNEFGLCLGCGKPLLVENAWMFDGCPCNEPRGVNDNNAGRWAALWRLQQNQSMELEKAAKQRDLWIERSGQWQHQFQDAMTAKAGLLDFLKRAGNEGRIISSNDLTELQMCEARTTGRWYVDPDTGYGWAILPWDLRTKKDAEREASRSADLMAR
jgi:hypothetical protein